MHSDFWVKPVDWKIFFRSQSVFTRGQPTHAKKTSDRRYQNPWSRHKAAQLQTENLECDFTQETEFAIRGGWSDYLLIKTKMLTFLLSLEECNRIQSLHNITSTMFRILPKIHSVWRIQRMWPVLKGNDHQQKATRDEPKCWHRQTWILRQLVLSKVKKSKFAMNGKTRKIETIKETRGSSKVE